MSYAAVLGIHSRPGDRIEEIRGDGPLSARRGAVALEMYWIPVRDHWQEDAIQFRCWRAAKSPEQRFQGIARTGCWNRHATRSGDRRNSRACHAVLQAHEGRRSPARAAEALRDWKCVAPVRKRPSLCEYCCISGVGACIGQTVFRSASAEQCLPWCSLRQSRPRTANGC
jgi:hypothetical protein